MPASALLAHAPARATISWPVSAPESVCLRSMRRLRLYILGPLTLGAFLVIDGDRSWLWAPLSFARNRRAVIVDFREFYLHFSAYCYFLRVVQPFALTNQLHRQLDGILYALQWGTSTPAEFLERLQDAHNFDNDMKDSN